jgi:hypothetical protein
MPDWYEVYDDEQVQLRTRQRVGWLSTAAVAALAVGLGSLPLAVLFAPAPILAAAAILGGILAALSVLGWQVNRLRRVVWCLKLSVHRVVGYDYARRKTELPWPSVERVEVDGGGLLLVGVPPPSGPTPALRVSHLFPDYPTLSHRVVEYAEAHGVPVCIEGRPWQLLDVRVLYPFLPPTAAVPRPNRPYPGAQDPA